MSEDACSGCDGAGFVDGEGCSRCLGTGREPPVDMVTDSGFKVVGLEAALLNVPEADREGVRAELLEMFASFDPSQPVGEPVTELPAGAVECPECGRVLETIKPMPEMGLTLLDCSNCDRAYVVPATPLDRIVH